MVKTFRRWAGVLAVLGVTAAISVAWGQSPKQTKPLSEAEFEKLHAFLVRQPGESRWMEIDWHPTVKEGLEKAAAEGKPLFFWAGSGGAPAAGC